MPPSVLDIVPQESYQTVETTSEGFEQVSNKSRRPRNALATAAVCLMLGVATYAGVQSIPQSPDNAIDPQFAMSTMMPRTTAFTAPKRGAGGMKGRRSNLRMYAAVQPPNADGMPAAPLDPPAIVRQTDSTNSEDQFLKKFSETAPSLVIAEEAAVAPAGNESPFAKGSNRPFQISYGRFVENLDNYERVIFSADGQTATATDTTGKKYFTSPIINAPAVIDKLTANGVDVVIAQPKTPGVGNFFLSAASYILPPLLIFYLFFGRQQGGMGGPGGSGGMGNPMNMGRSNTKVQMEPDTGVKFDDVAGCDEGKAELVEIVDFLKSPDKYTKLGAKIPRGVVLEGPPGTGKTLLAKAVAGEAGVPFFAASGSEFVEMFVGVGASRVRDLFENAKKNAPCIVFIDEIDAVGRARGGGGGFAGGNQEQENTLNQILTEMDGFDGSSGVIVMAATNRADVLDPALLRPGRFDRRTTIGLPDLSGRMDILKVHAKGKPLADDIDLKTIAKKSMGFSGASLQNLMNEAAIYAARRNADTIKMADIDDALERIIVGLQKKGVVQTDKTKSIVAYHEAGHALLGALVPEYDLVQKITIIPRSNGAGGLTFFSPSEERLSSGLYTREYLECQLAVALGGRLAEEVIFGESKVTTGASSDIQNVARIARSMVTEWGMSKKVGPIAMDTQGGMMSQGPSYATPTLETIDAEVLQLVNNAYALGKKLMEENLPILHDVANSLLENEQIDGIQFQSILNKYNVVPKAYSDLPIEDLKAAGYIPKDFADAVTASKPDAIPAAQFKQILQNSIDGESTL